jgi:hypothetical protein
MMKDAAQRSRWTFVEAIKMDSGGKGEDAIRQ